MCFYVAAPIFIVLIVSVIVFKLIGDAQTERWALTCTIVSAFFALVSGIAAIVEKALKIHVTWSTRMDAVHEESAKSFGGGKRVRRRLRAPKQPLETDKPDEGAPKPLDGVE